MPGVRASHWSTQFHERNCGVLGCAPPRSRATNWTGLWAFRWEMTACGSWEREEYPCLAFTHRADIPAGLARAMAAGREGLPDAFSRLPDNAL